MLLKKAFGYWKVNGTKAFVREIIFRFFRKIDRFIFFKNRKKFQKPILFYKNNFQETLLKNVAHKPEVMEYVPCLDEYLDADSVHVKLIAFYLPQFHPCPENDRWWGKGFTEWTNVSKALPQFEGHYQPRLPGELGFYDLRIKEVQCRQIELAKQYGVYGFCYHHYWFAGKRLLQRPFDQVLADPSLDFPFCLCWANENWTRRWDGSEDEVLIAQQHSPEDDIAFIKDIEPALRDPRYIRIDGKPLLIVYRITLLPDPKATAERWRQYCKSVGIGDLHLVAALSFEINEPQKFGFDAGVEFPPHQIYIEEISHQVSIFSSNYQGEIFDYRECVKKQSIPRKENYMLYRTVMPSWDNAARKPGRGYSFANSSSDYYSQWLFSICQQSMEQPEANRLVFVNAWNEWGEGAYLEPDRRFGYSNLHATRTVLRKFSNVSETLISCIKKTQKGIAKRNEVAVILHLYHEDLWDEIVSWLNRLPSFDLYVSLQRGVREKTVDKILSRFPHATLYQFDNRGRDILPFLKIMEKISAFNYSAICKIHSKKSSFRKDGVQWRGELLDSLMTSTFAVKSIILSLQAGGVGLIGPRKFLLSLSSTDYYFRNTKKQLEQLLTNIGRADEKLDFDFFAGSMFWFKGGALSRLIDLGLSDKDFPDELGQLDGTMAHAIERMFCYVAKMDGYEVACVEDILEKSLRIPCESNSL